MHRGLSFVSIVAVVGLFLNTSAVGFAQDQLQQEDSSIDDDSDAVDDTADDSATSGDSEQGEEQPAAEPEDEQEVQTPSEIEESQDSEPESEQDAGELEETEPQKAEMDLSAVGAARTQTEVAATTGQLALELGTFFRSDDSADTYAFAPILSLWFEITDALDLVLEAGCAYAGRSDEAGENPSHFYLGNPYLGIRRAFRADRTQFHFGFGFTVPISSMDQRTDPLTESFEETTYRIASAIRGRWSYWLWMPEHIALVIPIGARMVSEGNILFGGELGLAVIAPTGDYHDHRGDFVAQGAGELGFGFETVETGIRLQAVLIPMITNEDKFQSAIGPFVKLILDGGHVGANVMVNLDEDEGVFGKEDRWGLNLQGGVDF